MRNLALAYCCCYSLNIHTGAKRLTQTERETAVFALQGKAYQGKGKVSSPREGEDLLVLKLEAHEELSD